MTYWLVQLVGLIAVAICIYAYTRQHDQNLKTGLAASKFMMAAHFMLMDLVVPAASCLLAGVRFQVSVWYARRWMMYALLVAAAALGVMVVSTPLDLLPIAAISIATIAAFACSGLQLRLMLIITAALWAIYSAMHGSIGGVLVELLGITVCLIGMKQLAGTPETESRENRVTA